MRYNFPGNIRELENTVERAALLADGRLIEADDLRLGEASSSSDSSGSAAVVKLPPTGVALEEIERQALVEALRMSNWVQKDAAELLHISPRVMNYKIKVLGIELPRTRRAIVSEVAGEPATDAPAPARHAQLSPVSSAALTSNVLQEQIAARRVRPLRRPAPTDAGRPRHDSGCAPRSTPSNGHPGPARETSVTRGSPWAAASLR